ncbi:hypothetical protein FOA43_004173 [Brettanomyces nanus]|uniref:Uncharacterized protein n=1 Tax=Eeniella nana TaxID=13502 RepID=A0A875SB49_EENNA|nr:uncharacterized protein FOA43_004173 [Brettanomyces nanus]QPG76779.1 hypothetical protein FOA43_004173 [Brettanomyces nanus]
MTEDSESTPLIESVLQSPKRDWRTTFRRYRLDVWIPIAVLSCLLVVIIITFFQAVLPNIGDYAAQGTTFDLENLNFLGVSDAGGVNFEVMGVSHNNFSQIEDPLARKYFKVGGFMTRKLNLKVDDLDFLVYDEIKDDYLKLGRVHISPFSARVVDSANTDMDVYLTVFPDSKGVLGTIEKILRTPNSKLKLKGDADVKILVFNGYIPLKGVMIPLDIDIPTSLVSRLSLNSVDVSNVKFTDSENGKSKDLPKCLFDLLLLENPIKNLLKIVDLDQVDVPSSVWNIFINDCNGNPKIDVASLQTSKFIIENSDEYNISCSLDFNTDLDKLSDTCKHQDFPPLSKFVDTIVHNDTVSLLIGMDSVSSLPSTLSSVLKEVVLPLNIPLNITDLSSQVVENVTMEEMSFGLADSQTPMLSGVLKVILNFKDISVEGFKVKEMKGFSNLKYQGEKFGDVDISQWKESITKMVVSDNGDIMMIVSCKLDNVLLDITDMTVFQEILSEVIMNGSAHIDIEALVDVLVKSMLGTFEIDGIPGSGGADFEL